MDTLKTKFLRYLSCPFFMIGGISLCCKDDSALFTQEPASYSSKKKKDLFKAQFTLQDRGRSLQHSLLQKRAFVDTLPQDVLRQRTTRSEFKIPRISFIPARGVHDSVRRSHELSSSILFNEALKVGTHTQTNVELAAQTDPDEQQNQVAPQDDFGSIKIELCSLDCQNKSSLQKVANLENVKKDISDSEEHLSKRYFSFLLESSAADLKKALGKKSLKELGETSKRFYYDIDLNFKSLKSIKHKDGKKEKYHECKRSCRKE